METIKQVIDRSIALSEKLMAENPGLFSLSFEFRDFPLDEIERYQKENKVNVQFHPSESRFGFLVVSSACIHIRSVKVKARVTYDEVKETELHIQNP